MSFPTAYTPLESLLLFQGLRAEGANSHAVFNRISEQLKRIPFVHDDPSYDSGRLSPDALKELYLWLLKEEAKRDLERQSERDDLLRNGTLDPAQRKRKAPSPTLPTVHEASQHAHLIPQLVTRLYARYREHAVRDIREHERKYHSLRREAGEIEDGKWDDRLQKQRTVSRTQSPKPSSSAHPRPAGHKLDTAHAEGGNPALSNGAESTTAAPPKPYKGNKIGDVMNHGPEPQNGADHHRRTSSGTVLPPLSEMAPQSPRFGIPPKVPGPLSTQIPTHGFSQSPTSGHQSPYASHHGHPVSNSMASPQVQNALSRPSSSPRPILPPPPGMKLPPPSPGSHSTSPGLHGPPMPGHQQYPHPHPPPHRLSTGQSPTTERPPRGYPAATPHPMTAPHQQGYYQYAPYQDRRTSYPPAQAQPGYPMSAPHAGGYQLPPFSVETHQPAHSYQPAHVSQSAYAPRHQQYSQYPPSAPATVQRPMVHEARLASDIATALATPPRQKWNRSFKRPPPNLDLGTPVPSPVTEIEPFSPVLERPQPPGRSTRSTRNRHTVGADQSAGPAPSLKSGSLWERMKRDRSPQSVVSSTADDRTLTRSHSVSTAAGALPLSDDRPGSRGNVKLEPSTPAGSVEILEASHEIPSASGGPMTRKRRGTLQSHPNPPAKRTRQHSPDRGASEEDWTTPPPRPTTVIATRNFHKMSGAIMNDINSHKHAAYFAKPVRDKDAPGYSEIIKQPQNLNSIRHAIASGAKTVNATLDSPSTADATSGTVELERTADLVPPKAIVNGAQLEKETLRMLANAVMFNPGEDGMVSDTREMFEDVATMLEQWRGAEKEIGEQSVVEEAGEDEGRSKRARKA